jgi:membrane-bound lytic murein transglycosylase B
MLRLLSVALLLSLLATRGHAAQCGGDFHRFVAAMWREAAAQGVSQNVINAAFAGVTQDQAVLAFDRRQRGSQGKQRLQRHAALLNRIEQQYGVQKEVLVAIWGLESDFGTGDMGKLPVVRVLATMAHDCRRTELFQRELLAALKILQHGDLSLNELKGAYAGELGQTQFLPSNYLKFGVDYDGNGRVDLIRSTPDVLASTANLLKGSGWRAGQPFDEGTENFEAMREWNRAVVYRKTIAYFAHKLMGR